ncbi:NACHT, LRR and PYD domains-containing protein 12 isoform X1 [Exaiptasia diaphana]|uniref:NACHT domain-containing protein n=1 Tax=Exaiptasia diaphana TaxID=2652724 RepID=A0A913WQR4_EXADI|nr:NACHT, LRR and PYD domains-containing protein 12 isoform X1 [Exaiptasia diaphana]
MATGFTRTPSAREKTNHTRLSRLLVDIGRRVLQDVFDSIHPASTLHGVLNSVQSKLKKLPSNVLNKEQWNILYPSSGVAESKNFEFTLLLTLLRNICSLRPPGTGWKKEPMPTDLSMEADLVRIRLCRNYLAHQVHHALTDDEFEKKWDETEAALNRLGKSKYKTQIQHLKFTSIDHEKDMCFYGLLNSLEDGEVALRSINDTVTKELQTLNEKVDVINETVQGTDQLDNIRHSIENLHEKLDDEYARDNRVNEEEMLQQFKNLHLKLDSFIMSDKEKDRKVQDDSCSSRVTEVENNQSAPSFIKNPVSFTLGKFAKRRLRKKAKSYSKKLKTAILETTEMQEKPPEGVSVSVVHTSKTDEIFTNLTVHHRQHFSSSKAGKTVTEIKKCSEIFVGGEQDNPKSILVAGKSGVGKTLFSQKLIRDLAAKFISIPDVKFTYLLKFRDLNDLIDKDMNLKDLLNHSPLLDQNTMINDDVMEYFIDHPEKLFIVLDGFDEYTNQNKIDGHFRGRFPNDVQVKMPVSDLVSKLVQKQIMRKATITVTSRVGEAHELDQKIHFDRYVEIAGFSELQVIKYVEKYFQDKSEVMKAKALDKVKGSAPYIEFGSIPFRCFLMCVFIEWEIKNNRDESAPVTLTEFYSNVIKCIERNYNKAILSLKEEDASLAVDKTLDNFAKLAAYLVPKDRFSFSVEDLERLELTEDEIFHIKKSNLLFRYPVSSNSPFNPRYVYSFTHFTIQEFFYAWQLMKMEAMPQQGIQHDMVCIFLSGLFGIHRKVDSMVKLLNHLAGQVQVHNKDRQRVYSLRCLYEFGQDQEFTIDELTSNRYYRYWDDTIARKIKLDGVTDTDCSAVAMLINNHPVTLSSPPQPRALHIFKSSITCFGLKTLLPPLTKPTCNIATLELSDCQLDDRCVECLSQYLSQTKLTMLKLGNNEITDLGVIDIVNHCSSSLQYLHLVGNNITDNGVEYIVSQCQSSITGLYLSNNEITDVGVNHIMERCPSTLTSLTLLNNPVSEKCRNDAQQFFKGIDHFLI